MKRDMQNNIDENDLSVKNMISVLLLVIMPLTIPSIIIAYVGISYFDVSNQALMLFEVSWIIIYIIVFKILKKKIIHIFSKFFK